MDPTRQPETAEESISVPSEDPKKPEGPESHFPSQRKDQERQNEKDKREAKELSEEDEQLKGELELLVERLKEDDASLYRSALEHLRTLIRTATSSMTSVPKPLKFLRPHFNDLEQLYNDKFLNGSPKPDQITSNLFADILSVLAMTYSDSGARDTLHYRLLTQGKRTKDDEDPGLWGHEYVRHLAAEISEENDARQAVELGDAVPQQPQAADESEADQEQKKSETEAKKTPPKHPLASFDALLDLALQLVPFFLGHNGEADAVDLLLELESIEKIEKFVDENTYQRVCTYMVGCVNLLVPPDDHKFLTTARSIYRAQNRLTEAIMLSLKTNDMELVVADLDAAKNVQMKKQLAYILARNQISLPQDVLDRYESSEADAALIPILNNAELKTHFTNFAKTLNLHEPPLSLEDVYKSHLDDNPSPRNAPSTSNVDSARQNLAGTFVNAFVNVGCANDKLMAAAEEGQSWIYKNKDSGMLSAAASLGLSYLWDADEGLSSIDPFSHATEEYIKAGALLGNGLVHSGIRSEMDAALALLSEYTESQSVPMRTSAITGLGIAYAGSARQDILEVLLPSVADTGLSMEISALAALSLGFVFVGTGMGDVASSILQCLMEREEADLNSKWTRFMGLGLALLYLGKPEEGQITIETLKAIEHPISQQTIVLVDALSYAGTGNVLKIQNMLHMCLEHLNVPEAPENAEGAEGDGPDGRPGAQPQQSQSNGDASSSEPKEPVPDTHQAFAVLGIALIAMGEEIGAEMSVRHFNHLMHYGEPVIRRTVPLALGLISVSNPQLVLIDTLSRYSHDHDLDVALSAIFAMGLIGAGTNNAKLAQMLRQLANYYYKEPDCLFIVRIAQGMIHMGKAMVGLSPFNTDRFLMHPVAVAGLISTLVAYTDVRGFILDQSHWMLYFLTMAMYPRFLITLDEADEKQPVSVRVGQAVDTIGQAGKPRTIAGFQTHTTPVRMGNTERAELATEEYFAYSHVLEGLVILKKNENFESQMDVE